MRPAQKAPENNFPARESLLPPVASMRPAQKAPENVLIAARKPGRISGFNEAGAKSAGKRQRLGRAPERVRHASMRPAQKAPENERQDRRGLSRLRRFNEAGAKSAGKRDPQLSRHHSTSRFNEAGAKSAGKLRVLKMFTIMNNRSFNEAGAKSAGKRSWMSNGAHCRGQLQ